MVQLDTACQTLAMARSSVSGDLFPLLLPLTEIIAVTDSNEKNATESRLIQPGFCLSPFICSSDSVHRTIPR
jgi:hypothetical protein